MNPRDEGEHQVVLVSANPALLAIAKSLLESAGIDYVTSGEGTQIDSVIPVRVAVDRARADEARELLSELEESAAPDFEPDDEQ